MSLRIPEETRQKQWLAADPARSAWVSANAGSGKTHVLAQRVIRLLLDGVEPSKILCLTYTKAAAANMANRVFATLAGWTLAPDEDLHRSIAAMTGREAGPRALRLARQLFAAALETPGGLKIQTIHAFCESVLHQFPLEANIAGHFELLDPLMEQTLVAEATRVLVTGAASEGGPDPQLAEAFATVLQKGGEAGLDSLLGECLAKRDALRRFLGAVAGDTPPFASLFEELGLDPSDAPERAAESAWPPAGFDAAYFRHFAAAARASDAGKVLKSILPFAEAAYAETDPRRRLDLAAKGFLDSKGSPYADGFFKKALLAELPDLLDRYGKATATLVAARERIRLIEMARASVAALTVADRLIGRYEELKRSRGFLDFNDLIQRTVNLLARRDAGAWVQYKLDRGIDHILVDEAQDTSPEQWQVIRGLAEEFFAGSGASGNATRTVFAVGDEKQSIYSFQGADPRAFAEAGEAFKTRVRGLGKPFEDILLRHSFRSTEDVLTAVDRVFAQAEARRGLQSDDADVVHPPIREGVPGSVEIWESLGPEKVEEPDDWTEPVDQASKPAVRLAGAIAATVARWIADGEALPGRGRPIAPGDIMVLVRRRDSFVHALSRALKASDPAVPVAGADRLSLQSHIAVRDLIALARILLQPDDDLSLAALLRSPVFGLSDDALFAIAHGRGADTSLMDALRKAAETDAGLARVAERLHGWAREVRTCRVFDFYARVLGRDGVQAAMVGRLGADAGEILDEFLNFCLAEEKTGLPGLESFLATLEMAGPEIKRQMDQTRDEVQIMTVHAAKGLEAPIVFLVDNGARPFSTAHLPRLVPFSAPQAGWGGPGFLWRASSDIANPLSRDIEQRIAQAAEEEYRRLLYVGMTRAEDRLVVCGYHGARPGKEPRWHGMVCDALLADPMTRETTGLSHGLKVHRFELPGPRLVAAPEAKPAASAVAPLPPPAWLHRPVAPPDNLPAGLSPSAAGRLLKPDADVPAPGLSLLAPRIEASFAAQRGTAMHRLFETLPDCDDADRDHLAERHLARVGADWSEADRVETARAVLRILRDPDFAAVFDPSARSEVAVCGTLRVAGRDRIVSGSIDRLAVSAERVMLVDFKTGRSAPDDLAAVPEAHLVQMALYRALLEPIYPGREIACALLYTEAPRLLVLPASSMRKALDRLSRA